MAGNKPTFILDSFAILAYFHAEAGGERVLELLKDTQEGHAELAMSLINVGEIVYITRRNQGRKNAEAILKDLYALPITFHEASEEQILSYADSFAVQLAQELRGTLVTGDREFESIKDLKILWLMK